MTTLKTNVSREGFDAVLYPVSDRKDKIVITLSGSEGGLQHAGKLARFHQEQGMPALALGYFGTKGTGKALSNVPLEYVEKAICWLKAQNYKRIAIEGVSKGAEYALAAATLFPELTCLILKTPSWFCGEGLIKKTPSGTSSWSYKGKELPYTPYKERKFQLKKTILQTKEYNILSINSGKTVQEDSVFPVEKVNGPVLIFATKADTVWPSAESGERLDSRLTQKGFTYPHKYICFSCMSHMMLENANRLVRLLFKSEKEHPDECARERKEMGTEAAKWLEDIWQ